MNKIPIEKTHASLIRDGVSEHEQTLHPAKPFWVLFVANLGIGTWLMGVIIAKMNLTFVTGMGVLFSGSFVGSLLPALTATIGPRSRLSQIEAGRLSLGLGGKRIPAFLNWVGAIGWDVINNIIASSALVLLLSSFGLSVPFWLALGILVTVQMIIDIYGHHMIQATSRWTGVFLTLFFIVIGVMAMRQSGSYVPPTRPAGLNDILSALLLITIYNTSGWTTYTADYTRYLPRKTPSFTIFLGIFLALFLSLVLLGFFGFMTAASVTEETPAGVMKGLQQLTGKYSGLVLLLVGFSAIPSNAVNGNSAAYSLMSSGFRYSRPAAAMLGAVTGYVICLLASGSFLDFFENFLLLFAHWIAPWGAVVLVHWHLAGNRSQKTEEGISLGGMIFILVSIGSLFLFSSNGFYRGPVATLLGGNDIGPFVGFLTAGLIYYAATKRSSPG